VAQALLRGASRILSPAGRCEAESARIEAGGADMIEWFDDVRVGMRFKTGEKLVTREDIKRFAAEFDPQPYHLDEAAAERSMFERAFRFRLAYGGDVYAAGGRGAAVRAASALGPWCR
jgi:acyl dehydratase